MDDLISRQEALNALNKLDVSDGVGISSIACGVQELAIISIQHLPSAQPKERTENRTETHACDCISRQAAIDGGSGT